jgi:hypothetical protein
MAALDNLQGDWWWSFLEEPSAGQRWRIEGDRITHRDHVLAWSATPDGIRVEQPNDTFILIEPSTDDFHPANLYLADLGLEVFEEAGSLVPFAEAEASGWTTRHSPGDP